MKFTFDQLPRGTIFEWTYLDKTWLAEVSHGAADNCVWARTIISGYGGMFPQPLKFHLAYITKIHSHV